MTKLSSCATPCMPHLRCSQDRAMRPRGMVFFSHTQSKRGSSACLARYLGSAGARPLAADGRHMRGAHHAHHCLARLAALARLPKPPDGIPCRVVKTARVLARSPVCQVEPCPRGSARPAAPAPANTGALVLSGLPVAALVCASAASSTLIMCSPKWQRSPAYHTHLPAPTQGTHVLLCSAWNNLASWFG